MRRILAAAAPAMPSLATATSAGTSHRPHSHSHAHSHSHGGGGHHNHSHAAIEKEIEGENLRQCKVVTVAGGATNIFFCVTKLWFGSSGGSVALVADGFHALTDILADVVSYASISLSKRKFPRCRFPFGIGRLETSGAVFVAAILLIGGLLLLIQSARSCAWELGHVLTASAAAGVTAMAPSSSSLAGDDGSHDHDPHHGHDHGPDGYVAASALAGDAAASHGHSHGGGAAHGHSHFEVTRYDADTGSQIVVWTMVMLAASSVVCKELLFHWTRRVGKRAGSRVVVANAYHHRADAWSGGVALIGVAGQLLGIPGVDGIAGLVVSLSICKIGYGLFRDSVFEFFDFQNAEEVGQVRERLQDFHLRVQNDGGITAERNQPGDAIVNGRGNGEPSTGLQESNIWYINVFLMRHGHSYALHVQLLVHESQTAAQIKEATDKLEKLAKESLPIKETFISLLVCSPRTMPREEYRRKLHRATYGPNATYEPSAEARVAHGVHDHDNGHGHDHAPNGKCASQGSRTRETIECDGEDPEMRIAAQGALVNPSLEECVKSLAAFHGFTTPIWYDWEARTVTTSRNASCECGRDVESVAKIFNCTLVEAGVTDCEDAHDPFVSHSHNHSSKKLQ